MFRFNFIKIVSVLILLGTFTQVSLAGITPFLSETRTTDLVAYFDLRQRNSFVQVTNVSSTASVTVHVQIFADTFNCEDRNFTDTLTPNETHVYDIRNLVFANGNSVNFQIPDGSHGFVVISAGNGTGLSLQQIIGNFRIVDDSGYEYRTNTAGLGFADLVGNQANRVARFTDNWGANFSDIVGVDIDFDTPDNLPDGTRDFTVDLTRPMELSIFDDEENPTSCSGDTFGCTEGDPATVQFINQGINDVFPNSRGGGVLCSGDFNTDGFIRLTLADFDNTQSELVGYIGLNDGVGRGSMDRFRVANDPNDP